MSKCALCLQREADKKGSHLVPHFLMKTIDNVHGKPGRDLELGFELAQGHVKSYFGGAVLPERLEPVLGEVSDEDIANSRSSMIVDYLLCSHCESRLGKLESSYSNSLKNFSDQEYLSNEESFHSLIFWTSIFWRLSVSDNKQYKLNTENEEKLRVIIDEGLNIMPGDVQTYVNQAKNGIKDIGYKLLRCYGYTFKNNAFVFLDNRNDNPYSMLVGEFSCFLYMDEKNDSHQQEFLGLEETSKKAAVNTVFEGEKIYPVSMEVFSDACSQGVEFWKNDFINEVDQMCDAVHLKFIGEGKMDPKIKAEVIHTIVEGDLPLGRKYEITAIVHAISITLMQYEPYRSIAERM
ncbi:hypothetical protein [Pedobacter sp. P26]|uniref:hypothetical protein n=1 Tax=Pedobacter sp. P26 TaxID=3423956 RepID=UPI003D67A24C